jgi:hypothetical protein
MGCKSPATECGANRRRIDAQEEWNDTGWDVVLGHTYRFTASGTWCDSSIQTDADGFDRWYLWLFRSRRRSPSERWFRLIGMVDREVPITLGASGTFQAPASGRLYCFANDWPSKRGNNRGSVCLYIEPIGGGSTPS